MKQYGAGSVGADKDVEKVLLQNMGFRAKARSFMSSTGPWVFGDLNSTLLYTERGEIS